MIGCMTLWPTSGDQAIQAIHGDLGPDDTHYPNWISDGVLPVNQVPNDPSGQGVKGPSRWIDTWTSQNFPQKVWVFFSLLGVLAWIPTNNCRCQKLCESQIDKQITREMAIL